ncbi:hypothetical protein [Sulfobacillus thermosulfidooxidans]|uniref:hypothetical protein n=1 Tax=Sulfobacillus thermosulfidooxidans TaxID=28034 RepID=UPI0006B42A22|nr:hypothetical protein [Sulfobacillus thermosulfidooxidans]
MITRVLVSTWVTWAQVVTDIEDEILAGQGRLTDPWVIRGSNGSTWERWGISWPDNRQDSMWVVALTLAYTLVDGHIVTEMTMVAEPVVDAGQPRNDLKILRRLAGQTLLRNESA